LHDLIFSSIAYIYIYIYIYIVIDKKKKITELMDDIRENVSVLTLLAEVLCLLDMIVNSFAHMISTKPVDRYTRPEFTGNKIDHFYKYFVHQ